MENVRAEFNETLFARAEAGGFDPADADALFASAFAQTLLFGLLLAREAGAGAEIDQNALAAALGTPVTAQEAFDVTLALLSASSYTLRFGHDLENDYPAIPFPSDKASFDEAAHIGARIRALETFDEPPSEQFRTARVAGRIETGAVLEVGGPRIAYVASGDFGSISLLADQSVRIENVSRAGWSFSVSGYPVLQRWLRARNGRPLAGAEGSALLRSALDAIARVEELASLFDAANGILESTIDSALSRAELGLPPRELGAAEDDEDEVETT